MAGGARRFDVRAYAYAHRGLWGPGLSENSLDAFRAAARAGLGCELDVRPTRDGELVVFHDATLDRMSGQAGRVDQMSLAELQKLSLPDGSMIPLLVEAIDAMGGSPVLIELKIDSPGGRLADTVAATLDSIDAPLTVMSFDELTVARLREIIRDRPVGQLIEEEAKLGRDGVLAKITRAKALGCDYLAPHFSSLATAAGAAGALPLITWTVRSAETLAQAQNLSAASIFEGFDPALAKPRGTPI